MTQYKREIARVPILEVRGLSAEYGEPPYATPALRGVDLTLMRGELLGIAGESGSGKSTLAYAISRLLRPPGNVTAGTVKYIPKEGPNQDVLAMNDRELRAWRWDTLAHVSQAALNALNPVATIGSQITDSIQAHRPSMSSKDRVERAAKLLDLVDLPSNLLRSYPFQLSGGMRQRVMIASALALDPEIVIMDEPTTALDVVVQREILDRVEDLRRTLGFAVIFITHDMSLLLEIADSIAVVYGGRIVEVARAQELGSQPKHPYTQGLLQSFPSLTGPRRELVALAGSPPGQMGFPAGCAFHPRCPYTIDKCRTIDPELIVHGQSEVACHVVEMVGSFELAPRRSPTRVEKVPQTIATSDSTEAPVLEARDLSKNFLVRRPKQQNGRRTSRGRVPFSAVQRVSVALKSGRALALVGESGSGKSTVARILAGLEAPTTGTVLMRGRPLNARVMAQHQYNAEVQLVFQDPFASLNPLHTVRYHLTRALRNFKRSDRASLREDLDELLRTVQLAPSARWLDRHPHELSGGERQRVAIARALAPQPTALLADEPVSMLDVSIRLGVLNLLRELKETRRLAMLYITHDIASARHFADEISVMYRGEIVESGPVEAVVGAPAHPYTQLLIASSPSPDRNVIRPPRSTSSARPSGEPDVGCPFAARCPHAMVICVAEKPPATDMGMGHWVRCFMHGDNQGDASLSMPAGSTLPLAGTSISARRTDQTDVGADPDPHSVIR